MKTERQRQWLAHVERAEQQGLSLAQYARQQKLNPQTLYAARSAAKSATSSSSVFIPVKTSLPPSVVLRLPSGLAIECSVVDAVALLQQLGGWSCSV